MIEVCLCPKQGGLPGTMASTRSLAAILAADVAGYSRLMGGDEEGTHERLRTHVGQLVDPKIAEHHGRVVKNTGDGFLADFSSVVDAVRCAVLVLQGAVPAASGSIPGVRRGRIAARHHRLSKISDLNLTRGR